MRKLVILFASVTLVASVIAGCSSAPPEPTPDLKATVDAMFAEAVATLTTTTLTPPTATPRATATSPARRPTATPLSTYSSAEVSAVIKDSLRKEFAAVKVVPFDVNADLDGQLEWSRYRRAKGKLNARLNGNWRAVLEQSGAWRVSVAYTRRDNAYKDTWLFYEKSEVVDPQQ